MGTGFGITTSRQTLAAQGKNGVPGNLFITDADLAAIDVKNGGKYVVVHTEPWVNGGQALRRRPRGGPAIRAPVRLLRPRGARSSPVPDRRRPLRPRPSIGSDGSRGQAECYTPADRIEQPTLAQMTEAALTVLAARPDQPFALFIEAGDVDFALHANNLDNAIGAIYSGEEAVRAVIRWVEAHSNWDESLLLVSSDHGHYLVVDDPQALAGSLRPPPVKRRPRPARNSPCASWGRTGNRFRRPLSSFVGPGLEGREHIRQGKLLRRGPYGLFVATDAQGRLAIEVPQAPKSFDVFIRLRAMARTGRAGRPRVMLRRSRPASRPSWRWAGPWEGSSWTPKASQSQGVTVSPSMEYKKRPGVHRQFGVGAARKTNAAGHWHFDSVPASMSEVFVEINHPGFRPLRRRSLAAEFGLERGRQSAAKIVLERGLTVTGKVTDEAGKPIAGALIRTKFLNDIREARTGQDGVYHLAGCEPRAARIVVSAKGRAIDMKELRHPAGYGSGRLHDEARRHRDYPRTGSSGKPAARARIFFQHWRGRIDYFEFDHISEYADPNGVWVWNEAPLDEFKADIYSPGDGMTLSERALIARPEEYVFRCPRPRHFGQGHRRGNEAADQGFSRGAGRPVQPNAHELGP